MGGLASHQKRCVLPEHKIKSGRQGLPPGLADFKIMRAETFKKYNLPDKPGVYFFLKGKQILYIGKATSLKSRVKSYFSRDLFETRGPLLVEMLAKATRIEWQATDSVLEALILEAKLIKKRQPKYNTDQKSDKSWNYVCITKDPLPKVVLKRERQLEFDEEKAYRASYGPFTQGGQLREALKIIRRIFPYLDGSSKQGYEFYKQLGLAPDLAKKKAYLENIKNIRLLFEGKKKKILKDLEKKMKEFAKRSEFEMAGEFKRQLFALKHINDIALLKNESTASQRYVFPQVLGSPRHRSAPAELEARPDHSERHIFAFPFRIEAYDVAHMGGKNMVGVMTVVEDGQAVKSQYRKFKIRTREDADDTGALQEVLSRRWAHEEWQYPNLIVVDGSTAQINAAEKVLREAGLPAKGAGIPVLSVVKDERHRPKAIKGDRTLARKYEAEVLLANSEAHRFAIAYHKNLRNRNFLN